MDFPEIKIDYTESNQKEQNTDDELDQVAQKDLINPKSSEEHNPNERDDITIDISDRQITQPHESFEGSRIEMYSQIKQSSKEDPFFIGNDSYFGAQEEDKTQDFEKIFVEDKSQTPEKKKSDSNEFEVVKKPNDNLKFIEVNETEIKDRIDLGAENSNIFEISKKKKKILDFDFNNKNDLKVSFQDLGIFGKKFKKDKKLKKNFLEDEITLKQEYIAENKTNAIGQPDDSKKTVKAEHLGNPNFLQLRKQIYILNKEQ